MGALSSCFGRDEAAEENTDESRRLLHTSYLGGYGATNNPAGDQPDSEAVRREREALDGIYHSLTDNVFDVFSAQAQQAHSQSNSDSIAQIQPQLHRQMQYVDPDANVDSHSHSASRPQGSQYTSFENSDDLASEEMRLRTIKKGRSGPMFISMNKGDNALKGGMGAVQAAMG